MYNPSTIKTQLFGTTPLIGWNQEDDPAKDQLDSNLVSSVSGRYFQEAHAALTLKNIFAIAPKFADYVYTAWSNATDYIAGNIVSKGGSNWRCVLAHEVADEGAQDPESDDGTYWEVYTLGNQKSDWLRKKVQGYALSVFDDFLTYKKWKGGAKSIIEERNLFDGKEYSGEVTARSGKYVGFEVNLNRHNSIKVILHKIGLHFTQAGSVTINLYHSSQVAPIQSQVCTITTANKAQFFDLNWELNYINTFGVGGSYRIEYLQSSAPGQSINKAKDWRYEPVNRQGYDYNSWKLWSPYVDLHPYYVAPADQGNPNKMNYEYTDNYGMDLLLSVYCDYTNMFVRQKSLFQNALIKGIGLKLLKEIIFNPNGRVNLNEANMNISKDELMYEVDGNPQGRATGLGKEYMDALNGIILDTSGLDGVCLPCTKRKLKMRTT